MRLSKEQKFTLIGLCLAIIVGGGIYITKNLQTANSKTRSEPVIKHSPVKAVPSVMVHICGQIRNPGVFKVEHGDRVVDVIELAGGAQSSADLDRLNLAQKVKDGQKIIVPPKVPQKKSALGVGAVNINTAEIKELESLPSVGPATAQRIVEGRPYSALEDLMKVPRIGKKTFEKLKDKISI